MKKFKNKYRIQSHRRPNWDYSADAFYFLTIVTQNRECNLGEIVNTHDGADQSIEMILSDFGNIVETEWFKSFEIRKELFLHEFILMPNHLHAIVEIYNENRDETVDNGTHGLMIETQGLLVETHGLMVETHGLMVETHGLMVETHGLMVETHGRASLPSTTIESIEPELSSIKRNPPNRLPKSISSFIAGFKSAVNTKIDDYIDEYSLDIPKYNKNNHFFQPNYHDHIIRNHIEFTTISNYIINNPAKWAEDIFHTKNT